MTRIKRPRFRRPALALAAALGALALAASTAAAASASVAGDHPSPAPTSAGDHGQQFKPEAFDVLDSSLDPSGNVAAYGPVHGLGGTDRQVTPTLDVFAFGHGDSVKVDHARIPDGTLDLGTCSLTTTVHDAWWQFDGGTGDYRDASGHGLFTLLELVSFPLGKSGRCELDGGAYGVESNGAPCASDHGRIFRPVFYSVEIQGLGWAKVGKHHESPPPCPCQYSPAPATTTPAPSYT